MTRGRSNNGSPRALQPNQTLKQQASHLAAMNITRANSVGARKVQAQREAYAKRTFQEMEVGLEFKKDAVRKGRKAQVSITRGVALTEARDEIADYLARNPTPKVY